MPVVEKPQLKHIKKTKMPEPVNNDEVIPSFELPNYELMHEDVKGDEVVLFVPPEKEEMVQQLLRPVADISSLKVVIQLPSIWYIAILVHDGTGIREMAWREQESSLLRVKKSRGHACD